MYRLNFTDDALEDIASIAEYIASQSGVAEVAERFVQRIVDRCEHLASLPGTMGRARPELGVDFRSSVFGNHVIFFRYTAEVFDVVRILEGHRDIDGVFNPPDDAVGDV